MVLFLSHSRICYGKKMNFINMSSKIFMGVVNYSARDHHRNFHRNTSIKTIGTIAIFRGRKLTCYVFYPYNLMCLVFCKWPTKCPRREFLHMEHFGVTMDLRIYELRTDDKEKRQCYDETGRCAQIYPNIIVGSKLNIIGGIYVRERKSPLWHPITFASHLWIWNSKRQFCDI